MKRLLMVVLLSGALIGACSAQSIDWTIRQVRDPVQLKDKLNSDGSTVDGRLDDLEASTNVYISSGLARFDVAGFTNGTLLAARVPFAAYSIAGFTNGTLALARFSASLPAYDLSGLTNGTLASGRLPAAVTAGTDVTNVIISADAKTNTIVVRAGQVISWTVGE